MKNVINVIGSIALCVLCVIVLLSVSGCANILAQQFGNQHHAPASNTPIVLGSAQRYTYQLAQELFANMQADKQYRYAVAGFVPVTNMQTNLNEQGPLMLLGHQLEQGLITEAVKRGYTAQDYKATNAIIMNPLHERALSRDLNHLSTLQNIDYYITGTITPQQNGAMVNARIINVRNKDVVAAATSFFPADLFWETEQVTLRNGQLYRTQKPITVSNTLE